MRSRGQQHFHCQTSKDAFIVNVCNPEFLRQLDFLQTHSCQVNLKDGSLVIGEEEIPLRKLKASKEPNCYKVVLTEGVCLLPLAEMVVRVRVNGAQAIIGDYWNNRQVPLTTFWWQERWWIFRERRCL